ncbi:hypothetical protein D9757_003015 [Collybiopsis confluens]|uniref:E2 ubiquitin-conjugating enzyme n=1 Tax=Collybiopsis confluens TaxID=2823264 RepID=A0A8H5HXI7_9AGAR|nr:hypothetical protein D9757_003015 [Collybiopsis confluens]
MPPSAASPMTLKRIHREVADLKREDLSSMKLTPSDDNLFLWKGQIPGPEGSVYEGGVFKLDVILASDYPFTAPRVTFKTRIYHMNISDRGDLCIDILKHTWSPALSLFKVLLSISSLLTDPNPRDPLVGTIANQFTTNRSLHDATARRWTDLYARPDPPPPPPPAPPVLLDSSDSSANSTPPAIGTSATLSAKARGKTRASSSRVAANSTYVGSSSSSSTSVQRLVSSSHSDPITIEDSDNEEGSTSKMRIMKGTKRKRADAQTSESEDASSALELSDGTNDGGEGRSRKRRVTSAWTAKKDSEVIVIDSDDED